ncbi:hypothetical protein K502DRAFT_362425 [Neoconidiobolus thromboides FSU 785]|nr:hypothetical protein K502DRAFT_362425 [Neoconidiobolus thromboides FSU 785]
MSSPISEHSSISGRSPVSEREAKSKKEEDLDKEILSLLEGNPEKSNKKKSKSKNKYSDFSESESDAFLSVGDESESGSSTGGRKNRKNGKKISSPSASESEIESEFDEVKYKHLNEIEREQLIAEKAEKRQKFYEKQELKNRFKKNKKNDYLSDDGSDEEYNLPSRPSRSRKKAPKALKVIKEKRKKSTAKQDYRTSSDDSFDESELKRVKEQEEEEEIEAEVDDSPICTNVHEILPAVWYRESIRNFVHHSQFEKVIEGCFVSVIVNEPPKVDESINDIELKYRVGRVLEVQEIDTPYKFDKVWTNKVLILLHGKHTKTFPMSAVSNEDPTEVEYQRYRQAMETDGMPPIRQNMIRIKGEQIEVLRNTPKTDEEYMYGLRSQCKCTDDIVLLGNLYRILNSMLVQARTSLDFDKVAEVQKEIDELDVIMAPHVERHNREQQEYERQAKMAAEKREQEWRQKRMQRERAEEELIRKHEEKVVKKVDYTDELVEKYRKAFGDTPKIIEARRIRKNHKFPLPNNLNLSWPKDITILKDNTPLNIYEQEVLESIKRRKL